MHTDEYRAWVDRVNAEHDEVTGATGGQVDPPAPCVMRFPLAECTGATLVGIALGVTARRWSRLLLRVEERHAARTARYNATHRRPR